MNTTLFTNGWKETAATPGAAVSPVMEGGSHSIVSVPVDISTFSMDFELARFSL